jgi:hypothetical protein
MVILTNDDGKRAFIEIAPKGQARNLLVTWRTPLVIVVGQRWRAEDRLIQGQKSR